ncbi:hypothetical protein MMC22_001299 [Lobaria immixta]|nr:hypothetical protein [Lobaria immixta]
MEAIFGIGPSETPELFSRHKGILMSNAGERRFDKGTLLLFPEYSRIPHEPRSKIGITGNQKYQTRVLEPDELDGQPVTFKSSFWPRARYLYFQYCLTILRRSWVKDQPSVTLRDELGRLYWGTPGRFMRKNMLVAFVGELGYDYEVLLDGAIGEADEPAAMKTALAAANDQFKIFTKGKDALSSWGGESDEEDGEDEE